MASQKEIRTRITSVEKTQKITSAMKVVAAAKLSRAQHAIAAARPYAVKLREVLGSVAAGVDADAHPLLTPRDQTRRLDVVLFSSDRGLCGAFNANVIKAAEKVIQQRGASLESISVLAVGRRGADHMRRHHGLAERWTDLGDPRPEVAAEIAEKLMTRYLEGETDEVALVFSEFRSAVVQVPQVESILPFSPAGGAGTESVSYEIEPDPAALLGLLLPRAVEFSVFRALLENAASEHGARMSAMDSATNNCSELIESLTLDMNKARQSAITQELSEIVGGAEAL